MGPLFNPVYWCFGLLILCIALGAAALTGKLTHLAQSQLSDTQASTPQIRRTASTLVISSSIGLLTLYGLCTWAVTVFTDPSIPKVKPSAESIIGQWSLDAFSRTNMQQDGGYTLSVHTLTFHADGTFEMVNMPDIWLSTGGHSHRGFYSGSGTWEIDQWQNAWVLWMDFPTLAGYPKGVRTSLTIGDWDNVRSLYFHPSSEAFPYLVSFKKE